MNKPQRIMQMVMAILIVVAAVICHSFGIPDGLILLVAGNDPEGVKDIQIWVEETRWFTDPNTGQETQQGPGSLSAPEQSNPDNACGGQTVCTSRLASLNLDLQQRRKGASRLRIKTWAQAVNFGGASVRTKEIERTWPYSFREVHLDETFHI